MSALNGNGHPIAWVTASPLWSQLLGPGLEDPTDDQRAEMATPSLLTMKSDNFMVDLNQLLATAPQTLSSLEAQAQSYRIRPPGVDDPDTWEPDPSALKLKLYQPFHGHFNLVAASLVCQIPGLPDRGVQTAAGDLVGFVMRRLYDGGELAWVDDPNVAGAKAWAAVDASAVGQVATGEKLMPMFGLPFTDGELTRRMFVGLIPTSSRETYRNAGPAAAPAPVAADQDPRQLVFTSTVLTPLQSIQAAQAAGDATDAQKASPMVALALAEFLVENIPGWDAIVGQGTDPSTGSTQRPLWVWLTNNAADPGHGKSWLQAARDAWSDRLALCGEGGTPSATAQLNLGQAVGWNPSTNDTKLLGAVTAALPTPAPTPANLPASPDPAAQPLPMLDPRTEARYVLRCVYSRPQCGALHDDVVSAPSEDFAIASTFDFDAPQRKITISLPIDTSPAGLRKFPKNVTFLLSDQLKQQMSRLTDLKSMTNGEFGSEGSLDIGLVCSFSIPIITICALFVLMIFISLLNIVFFWLPLFRICLPLGLSKGSSS